MSFIKKTGNTVTTTISLHDALPICTRTVERPRRANVGDTCEKPRRLISASSALACLIVTRGLRRSWPKSIGERSEEHTSELQSHVNLVCRVQLEKKYNVVGVCVIMS